MSQLPRRLWGTVGNPILPCRWILTHLGGARRVAAAPDFGRLAMEFGQRKTRLVFKHFKPVTQNGKKKPFYSHQNKEKGLASPPAEGPLQYNSQGQTSSWGPACLSPRLRAASTHPSGVSAEERRRSSGTYPGAFQSPLFGRSSVMAGPRSLLGLKPLNAWAVLCVVTRP